MGTLAIALCVSPAIFAQQIPAEKAAEVADSTGEEVNVVLVQDVPTVPAELLQQRLARLQKTIPLNYNKTVHGFIDYFTFRKPSYTRMVMERIPMFFPLYEKYLEKYEIPDELKYLSIVESALNPKAISVASAGGLWQFMPVTGREYGLYQDEYVDERFDPVKSTDAACRYLKRLHKIFGDWHLALAAYNSGPGTVKRAMRRSGGDSFWTVYNYLPQETRAYVPQFIALTYMMHYANDHGIFAENPQYPIPFDTLHVNSYFNLPKFSKFTGIALEDLQKMNPALTTTVLPAHTRNYVLRVPAERFEYFESNRKVILDSVTSLPVMAANMLLASAEDYRSDTSYKKRDWFPFTDANEQQSSQPVVAANPLVEEGETIEEVVQRKPKKVTHTVRRGEWLGKIADKYGVAVYDLKKWNRLKGEKVAAGQKLLILKEPAVVERERVDKKPVVKAEPIAARKESKTYKPKYHIVQEGDTLWNISKRYGGISVDELKKLNNITDNTLKAGQKLILG